MAWSSLLFPDTRFEEENLDYHATIAYKNDSGVATFEVTLERKFGKAFVETIFPTSLLVLVGSVSFKFIHLPGFKAI